MSKIIPSTKLKVMTVHKMWDTACMRKYFWHRVLNLEPRKINMNFWYGGVLGAGWEAFLQGKKMPLIESTMAAESHRRTKRYFLNPEDTAEISFQRRLITLFIKGAMKQRRPDFDANKMKLTHPQQIVSYPLEYSKVTYLGTNDGLGTYRNGDCMFENKTAKYVNNPYLQKIAFDSQIHAYRTALEKMGIACPKKCMYMIFVKTNKRIKRDSAGQTSEGFLKEVATDIVREPKKFYILHEHRFNHRMLQQKAHSIEACAWRMTQMYDGLSESELLDPNSWDEQTGHCLYYGACEYLMLCKNLQSWKVCERLFQQREMLYDAEKEELQV